MSASRDYTDKGEQAIIPCIVLTSTAGIFVGVRSVLRFVYLRTTGPEDYTILTALLFSVGFTAFVVARESSQYYLIPLYMTHRA